MFSLQLVATSIVMEFLYNTDADRQHSQVVYQIKYLREITLHLTVQRKQLKIKLGQAHFVICEVSGPIFGALNYHNHLTELC